jgi:hypothetical protein
MSRLITRTIGATIGLVALLGSSPSLAQDEESSTAGAASAEETSTSPVATSAAARTAKKEDPRSHAHAGANLMLTGIVTLALSYGPAVYVGNESTLTADHRLQTPFAGPWIDLVSRPGCASSANCGSEPGYQALLMFDGFFQALSGIEILAGLIELGQEDYRAPKPPPPKAEAATLRVSPSTLGAAGYGLSAFGSF